MIHEGILTPTHAKIVTPVTMVIYVHFLDVCSLFMPAVKKLFLLIKVEVNQPSCVGQIDSFFSVSH